MSLQNDTIDVKKTLQHNESRGGRKLCRITTKLWKYMLLQNEDTVVIEGRVQIIKGKSLGAGVWQLYLKMPG